MPIYETFSRRQSGMLTGDLIYDDAPKPLRVQFAQILGDLFGSEQFDGRGNYNPDYNVWKYLTLQTRREVGVDLLPPRREYVGENFVEELQEFIKDGSSTDQFLNVVDIVGDYIDHRVKGAAGKWKKLLENAAEEVNYRFREHNLGYQLEGMLIRIDSELVHAEVVNPALELLRDKAFAGPQEEFLVWPRITIDTGDRKTPSRTR